MTHSILRGRLFQSTYFHSPATRFLRVNVKSVDLAKRAPKSGEIRRVKKSKLPKNPPSPTSAKLNPRSLPCFFSCWDQTKIGVNAMMGMANNAGVFVIMAPPNETARRRILLTTYLFVFLDITTLDNRSAKRKVSAKNKESNPSISAMRWKKNQNGKKIVTTETECLAIASFVNSTINARSNNTVPIPTRTA